MPGLRRLLVSYAIVAVVMTGAAAGCIELQPLQDVIVADAASHDAALDDGVTDGSSDSPTFVKMVSGDHFTLLLRSDGLVLGWGASTTGELLEVGAPSPPRRVIVTTGRDIAAGARHACVIDFGDRVHCWGDNADFQVGSAEIGSPALKPVKLDVTAQGVFAGPTSTCVTGLDAGELSCWGINWARMDPPNKHVSAPQPQGLDQVDDVSMGDGHLCVVRGGALACWGTSTDGALGDPDAEVTESEPLPFYPPDPAGFGVIQEAVGVGGGWHHHCALVAVKPTPSPPEPEVQLSCWGRNSEGQAGLGFGQGPTANKPGYPFIQTVSDVVSVAGGERHTCALDDAGGVFCWGDNAVNIVPGQPADFIWEPVRVLVSQAKLLSSGRYFACIVTPGDEVWCWGNNNEGELGVIGLGPGPHDPQLLELPHFDPFPFE